MFRCTDCNREYEQHPGYCECGNDQFEEIFDQYQEDQYADAGYDSYQEYDNGYVQDEGYDQAGYDDNYYADEQYQDYQYQDSQMQYNQQYQQPQYQQPQYQQHRGLQRNSRPQKQGKKKSNVVGIVVLSVCIILSLVVLFIPVGGGEEGNDRVVGTDNNGKGSLSKDYSIPTNIDTIWNSTQVAAAPSAEQVSPNKILNTKLGSLDQSMNSYLIGLAQAMIDNWDRTDISGNGVTQMEFVIDQGGSVVAKKIYKYSGNKTLDDSIMKLISSFGKYQIPPSSYKQEIIIVSFSAKNGSMKAYYPNIKPE